MFELKLWRSLYNSFPMHVYPYSYPFPVPISSTCDEWVAQAEQRWLKTASVHIGARVHVTVEDFGC